MEIRLKTQCNSAWSSFIRKMKGAVVFIDSKAGECIHWSNGTQALLTNHSSAVYDFSAYQFSSYRSLPLTEKAVFVSARSVAEILIDLCDILSNSCFKRVLLILTPIPEQSTNLPKLKQDLLQWMAIGASENDKNLSVEIICSSFFVAPLTENIICFPSCRDIFLYPECYKFSSLQGNALSLSTKELEKIQHLALCLDSLLSEIHACDIIFSLGPLSNAVGSAMESFPTAQQRRKVSTHKLSVVIVDRSLDLCTPTSFEPTCFLDKVLGALPHLPDHSIDVAINMSPLAQATVDSAQEESIFPGCLAHQSKDCINIIDTMIHKKKTDILLETHQILKSKTLDSKISTRVRPEGLEKDVRQFRGDYEKIQDHNGILQIALAVVQTLIGEHAEEAELLLSTEKILRQNIAASLQGNELVGVLPQVTKLVSERHIRGLTLDCLLTLLVHVYSLTGSEIRFPIKDEVQLQAAISCAMFEDQEYPGLAHATLVPLESSKEKIEAVAADIFAALKSFSNARKDLMKYKSLLKTQGVALPVEYKPLIHQLLSDITDPAEPSIPDLVCHSVGLKDLLKSGFSMLLNKQTTLKSQHPYQQPNLFLFILGGITGGEIKAVKDAWAACPLGMSGGALLIGGTSLLSPSDTLKHFLKSTQHS